MKYINKINHIRLVCSTTRANTNLTTLRYIAIMSTNTCCTTSVLTM